MGNERDDDIEIDLLELFLVVMRKIWIPILLGIVFALGTGLVTKFFIQPKYSSTAKLYILTSSTSLTSLADIQIGTSLTKDYVQLVQSRPVVEEVIDKLNINRTYDELLDQVTVTNPSDTRLLVITAVDRDPLLAKDIVDQFAEVSKAGISRIMKTEEPSIVELGYADNEPISPSLFKNTAIGGLLGFLLAAAAIVVAYLLNDTVKTTEDVEKYLGLNVLAAIPMREDDEKTSKNFGLKKKLFRRGKKDGKE